MRRIWNLDSVKSLVAVRQPSVMNYNKSLLTNDQIKKRKEKKKKQKLKKAAKDEALKEKKESNANSRKEKMLQTLYVRESCVPLSSSFLLVNNFVTCTLVLNRTPPHLYLYTTFLIM